MGCEEPIMVGVKEFARISGIAGNKIRMLAKIDGFPAMRCGGVKIMIHREKAIRWLENYVGHESSRHYGRI